MSGYPRFALYTSDNGMVSMTQHGITKEPIRVCMKKTVHETCPPAEYSSLDLFSAPADSGGARDAG